LCQKDTTDKHETFALSSESLKDFASIKGVPKIAAFYNGVTLE